MNAPNSASHELLSLQKQWWCFLALGITMVALGMIALGSVVSMAIVSIVAVSMFGALLMIGGVVQVVSSVWTGQWKGFLLHVLVGIFYIVTGYLLLDSPVQGALAMTEVIALFLLVSGLFRIVTSLAIRFHEWGWVLLNGAISVMLGVLIHRHMPASGLVAIGLFVGLEMLFNGWAWIMLAFNLRRHPATTA